MFQRGNIGNEKRRDGSDKGECGNAKHPTPVVGRPECFQYGRNALAFKHSNQCRNDNAAGSRQNCKPANVERCEENECSQCSAGYTVRVRDPDAPHSIFTPCGTCQSGDQRCENDCCKL